MLQSIAPNVYQKDELQVADLTAAVIRERTAGWIASCGISLSQVCADMLSVPRSDLFYNSYCTSEESRYPSPTTSMELNKRTQRNNEMTSESEQTEDRLCLCWRVVFSPAGSGLIGL